MRLLLKSSILTYFNLKKSNQINLFIFYFFTSLKLLKWVHINIRTVGLLKIYLKKNKY